MNFKISPPRLRIAGVWQSKKRLMRSTSLCGDNRSDKAVNPRMSESQMHAFIASV